MQFTSTPPLLPGCSLNAWCTVQAAVLMRSSSPLSLCLLPRWLNEFSHCRVQWKMSSRGWRSQQQLAGSLCKPLLYSWKLSMHVNAVSTPSVSAPWAAKSAWDGWCQIFIFISLQFDQGQLCCFVCGGSSSVSIPAAPLSLASLQLHRNLAVSDPASTGT